jgi:hypothetical protein
MTSLLGAELRRIVGRRGSFWGGIAFAVLITVIVVLTATPSDGDDAVDIGTTVGQFSGLIGAVVMGALAGSYDTANGTMRYLVLTGVPRWKIAITHLLGVMIAVLPMAAIVMVIALAWGSSTGGMTSDGILEGLWGVLSTYWTWGVLSAAIGMLMRSNGPAIAVSIVLVVGGTAITGAIGAFISESLAGYLLPAVFGQVSSLSHMDDDFRLSLGVAFVALAVWIVAIAGLAVARINRDEY